MVWVALDTHFGGIHPFTSVASWQILKVLFISISKLPVFIRLSSVNQSVVFLYTLLYLQFLCRFTFDGAVR